MIMNDVRFHRMAMEYKSLRSSQDKIMNGLDETLPAMILAIQENSDAIQENREAIEANREAIEANRAAIEINTQMLKAIIAHLEVPYEEKPPMGFKPE